MSIYKSIFLFWLLLLFGDAVMNHPEDQPISIKERLEALKSELQQCRINQSSAISQILTRNQTNNSDISAVNIFRSNQALVSKNKGNLSLELSGIIAKLDLLTAQQTEYEQKSAEIYQFQSDAITKLFNNLSDIHIKYQLEVKNVQNYVKTLEQQILKLQSQAKADGEKINELTQLVPKNCLPDGQSKDLKHIYVPDMGTISVSCNNELAGPGWTVIQRRLNGQVDFYRNWSEYTKGFGNVHEEFFLGLELLYQLTKSEVQELYIQLRDFKNETRFAHYNHFVVGSREENYKLKSLGVYTGNAGNMLIYNLYQNFSTHDNDNDFDEDNCASDFQGAWWYAACGASNLNGPYRTENLPNVDTDKGILWANTDWHDWSYSFKSVTMMIRPRPEMVDFILK